MRSIAIVAGSLLACALLRRRKKKEHVPPVPLDEAGDLAPFDMASLRPSLELAECLLKYEIRNGCKDDVLLEILRFYVWYELPDPKAVSLLMEVIGVLKSDPEDPTRAPSLPRSVMSLFGSLGHLYRMIGIDMDLLRRIYDALQRRGWKPNEQDRVALWHALCSDLDAGNAEFWSIIVNGR